MKHLTALLLSFFMFKTFAGVDPKTAYDQVRKGEAVLIDVREADEIKSGMIKDAKWFPMSQVNSGANWKKNFQKLADNKKIYLYCRSGNRSGKVQETLKENGIDSENLGGMLTLKDILPVQAPGQQ